MYRGYKIKLYPNEAQKVLLDKHFGCARWVYNKMIEINQKKYHRTGKGLSGYDMQSYLPKLKKQYPWLKEVNASSMQIVCHNLAEGYNKFFKKQAGYPKFKSRYGKNSFATINRSYLEDNKVRLPKLGYIKYRGGDMPKGKVKKLVISKSFSGDYYCSVLIDIIDKPLKQKKAKAILGIDLGLKDIVVTSKGEKIAAPKFLKSQQQNIRKKAKAVNRCKDGSNRKKIAKLSLAKAHEKIKNQRKDFNHKTTRNLVADSENQAFAVESLSSKNMMQNRKLAKSIADASWYQFKEFLTYKAEAVGKQVIKIDRFYPSSKTCSACGIVKQNLMLSERAWKCTGCKTTHDRDVNAAINIALEAARNSAHRGNVNPETLICKVVASEVKNLVRDIPI